MSMLTSRDPFQLGKFVHTLYRNSFDQVVVCAKMTDRRKWWIAGSIAGGIVGGAALIAAPYVVLPALGFGAKGVAAGTAAAAWQSTIGNVAAGSLFAGLQSAGAAGVAGTTTVGLAAAGATGGATVGAVGASVAARGGGNSEG